MGNDIKKIIKGRKERGQCEEEGNKGKAGASLCRVLECMDSKGRRELFRNGRLI